MKPRIVPLAVIVTAALTLAFMACDLPPMPPGWQMPSADQAPAPDPPAVDCSDQQGGPSPDKTWEQVCDEFMGTAQLGLQAINEYYCSPIPGAQGGCGGGGQAEVPVCIHQGGYFEPPNMLLDETALDDGIVILTDLNGENPVEVACPPEMGQ
ncbi:MAG: hypothetical protein WEE64_03005 [Dehalococcoidia bacterium]